MVRLTEEMVVARTRQSDFASVKKLNCWGTELTDVSILRKMKNVEVLSLSVNNINSLADFQFCTNLQDLFVRKNNISDLNEICYLQSLPKLRNLWLGENPCAEEEGYRFAVIRALPNLEKLDDKSISPEELQTAMTRGRNLVHPLEPEIQQSEPASPEQDIPEYLEDGDPDVGLKLNQQRRYSSSDDQRSSEECQQGPEEYHDTDKRNANYNTSPSHQYPQNNQYSYEEYDDRPVSSRHNGDYDDRRGYTEYSGNEMNHRSYPAVSPRTQYAPSDFLEDKRSERNVYDSDDRRQVEYDDSQPPRRSYSNSDKDEQIIHTPGWVRTTDRDKTKTQFHYHRRPVTRNSNILSAVLCLVKELDYPSLEVVEMAVRNRMDELEE